ncbi:hypothetical protein IC235_18245 [Hymenobacter sp. BT664]|uniref:Tc1-like transposase DDE domain-containing protein n=1 Tax=Hymenobacter montanus TaxID=2771359 RepID=A0A927BGN6_9BACT|nr:hypothetical protein [Hymenobacter montanus]MBD2769834.1 hypothetical protein [Hymenobacter montanus]
MRLLEGTLTQRSFVFCGAHIPAPQWRRGDVLVIVDNLTVHKRGGRRKELTGQALLGIDRGDEQPNRRNWLLCFRQLLTLGGLTLASICCAPPCPKLRPHTKAPISTATLGGKPHDGKTG